MGKVSTIKGLAGLIKKHPGSVFVLDNDYWWMLREPAENNPYDGESDDDAEEKRYYDWENKNQLITSDDMSEGSCVYGGQVRDAMALILDVEIDWC